MLRALIVVFQLAVCAGASAADVSIPPAPNPAALEADWWSYFAATTAAESKTLDERVGAAETYLRSLKGELKQADAAEIETLIDTLAEGLRKYAQLRTAMPTTVVPPPTVAEAYTIEQLIALIERLRQAKLDSIIEEQDLRLIETAIAAGERELSRKKVAYLELPQTAPDRLERGLDLMHTRVQLELAQLELKFRRDQKSKAAQHVDNLRAELEAATDRIQVEPTTVEHWQQQQQQAEQRVQTLKHRLARAQLAESVILATTELGKAQARLARQRFVKLETEIAIEQSVARTATLALLLLRHAGGEAGDDSDWTALREAIAGTEQIMARLGEWRQTSARATTTATTQIAGTEDQTLITMYESRLVNAEETQTLLGRLEDQASINQHLGSLLKATLERDESGLGGWWRVIRDGFGDLWRGIHGFATASLFEISETPVTTLGLLRVVLILTVAWWLSKLFRRTLQRVSDRRHTVSQSSVYTLGRILHYVILTVGIIIGLSSIGIDFTKFALFASALGVGIGFGLQTIISNFVAGLIILFEKSLKIGDFVELESGVTGEVKEINMRSTLITTNDNIDIVVPNSEFVASRVTNWTMREVHRRVHIPFGVAYGTDKDLVKKAALEAADEVPWTLKTDPKRHPQVWFVEFGDSSLNFELVLWLTSDAVKRPSAVHAAYLWEIESKLREYDIEVPFPQRDIHLRSAFGTSVPTGGLNLFASR